MNFCPGVLWESHSHKQVAPGDPPPSVTSTGPARNSAAIILGRVQTFFSFHVISPDSAIEKLSISMNLMFLPNQLPSYQMVLTLWLNYRESNL